MIENPEAVKNIEKQKDIGGLEIEEVTSMGVQCDGGGDALGHPRVFLNLGKDNQVVCPYCDKQFILKS